MVFTGSNSMKSARKNARRADSLSNTAAALLEKMEALRRDVQQLVRAVAAREEWPELPPADKKGNRPALESVQVILARKIIEGRKRAGLTQDELARRAGVRVETISRLESGRHAPNVRTLDKIDAALTAAGAPG
jgi:DNA-binding XRE family transcriptional regulator